MSTPRPRPNRRQFAGSLTAAVLAPLGSTAVVPAAPAAQSPVDVAEALAQVARLRYGKHLTREQLRQVAQSIRRMVAQGERLRDEALSNDVEPAFRFQPELP